MKPTAATLEIRRHLRISNAVTKSVCFPGAITVLSDEEGDGSLIPYALALSGQRVEERFTITWNGEPFEVSECPLVGFSNSVLPVNLSIGDFLLQAGFSAAEQEALFEAFELDSVAYLTCGQLSATNRRQLELLAALKAEAPVLVLNDPFQPFNGRWREHFAELLLNDAVDRERIIVITNLSFEPQNWSKREEIVYVDVGKAALKAARRAEARAKLEAEIAAAANAVPDKPQVVSDLKKDSDYKFLEYIEFAYCETRDLIFAPLSRLSNVLRSYSGVTVVICAALLIGILGYMAYPNIGKYHAKMKQIAFNLNEQKTSPTESKRVRPPRPKKPLAEGRPKPKVVQDNIKVKLNEQDSMPDEGHDYESLSHIVSVALPTSVKIEELASIEEVKDPLSLCEVELAPICNIDQPENVSLSFLDEYCCLLINSHT